MPRDLPLVSADILARIRARRPRVHCITNAVAQNFTANMLLAAGAVPSMTIASDEIADFVARADALLVNLGTLDPERRGAIEIAIATAGERVPWILDPVFVDRSAPRAGFAAALVARRPRMRAKISAETSGRSRDISSSLRRHDPDQVRWVGGCLSARVAPGHPIEMRAEPIAAGAGCSSAAKASCAVTAESRPPTPARYCSCG